MRKERRYTEGQQKLLKFDPATLEEKERELLRRVLLPRTKYLPQTDQEGRELAMQMLKKEKYDELFAMVGELCERYGELECRWTRGNRLWDLFYTVKKGGEVLCRFGLSLNVFHMIISFGREECERFERERDSFPRDAIQWTFDMAEVENGRKNLMFDISVSNIRRHIFQLLAYKRRPLHQ